MHYVQLVKILNIFRKKIYCKTYFGLHICTSLTESALIVFLY